MPWNAKSFKKHNKKLSTPEAAKAASVANALLAEGKDEGEAIRIANAGAQRSRIKTRYKPS